MQCRNCRAGRFNFLEISEIIQNLLVLLHKNSSQIMCNMVKLFKTGMSLMFNLNCVLHKQLIKY